MGKHYKVSGDGGTPRTGAWFIDMIHFVNARARNAGQEPVFGQPDIVTIDGVYTEVYPRCNVTIERDRYTDYDDNDRVCRGITFLADDDDVEVREWLEEARAHVTVAGPFAVRRLN